MSKKVIPEHIAIIPDGNRRWAKNRGFAATRGHLEAGSYFNVKRILKKGKDLGVRYISLWGFSTENWNRSKKEIDSLMIVLSKAIEGFITDDDLEKEEISIKHIGRKDRLPKELISKINELEKRTKSGKFQVLLCIDYGGRDEIIRAINKIKDVTEEVTEEDITNNLDTANIPDPDLIIRTGGEWRLSGFMPFQSTYSELYFTDLFFPEFGPGELEGAIEEFNKRVRRYGK